ncbi:hypothetical protein [Streptomyces sp. NPDC058674]|uniref:hypothetical protein n=1 Tax=Streptomyces sp. NPDC058674 TaxID=3346592 RepID=UPI00365244BB
MALSIADQQDAADLAAASTQLLGLDVIWTTGFEQGVPEGKTPASSDLIKVGLGMATQLGKIHKGVPLLKRFADELEVALLAQSGHTKDWTLGIDPLDVPGLLREAVKHVDDHATEEISTLLAKAERLEGGQAVQGDLPRRMRGAIYLLCAAVTVGLGAFATVCGGPAGIGFGFAGAVVAAALFSQGLSDFHA